MELATIVVVLAPVKCVLIDLGRVQGVLHRSGHVVVALWLM